MLKTRTKKIAIFIAVIGLLIFLSGVKILGPAESLFTEVFNPFFSSFYSAGTKVRSTYEGQLDKRDLNKLVDDLSKEINQLISDNSRLKVLEEENQSLREYLHFLDTRKYNYVMANVISRGEGDDPERHFVIDKGRDSGVEEGLVILDSQGIVLGKVTDVKDNISRVDLIINKNCRLAAAVLDDDFTSGVVSGELGLSIRMELIPQTEEIKEGDAVVTSGLENNIPKGLVIGRVSQVEKENNEIWQAAVIEPLINFDALTIVSVLLPQQQITSNK